MPRKGASRPRVAEGGPAELAELGAGFARAPAACTDTGAVLGSPSFVFGRADIDHRRGSNGSPCRGPRGLWRRGRGHPWLGRGIRQCRALRACGGEAQGVAATDAIARSRFVGGPATRASNGGDRFARPCFLGFVALRPECNGFSRRARPGRGVSHRGSGSHRRFCRGTRRSRSWRRGQWRCGDDGRGRLSHAGGSEPLPAFLAEDQLVRIVAAASATDHARRWDISARPAVKLSFSRGRGPPVEDRAPRAEQGSLRASHRMNRRRGGSTSRGS